MMKQLKGFFLSGNLIAFLIYFDFLKVDSKDFKDLCFGQSEKQLNYFNFIKKNIENKNTKYLLSIGVDKKYQQMGYGSFMIDWLINEFKNFDIVSDVSNVNSLKIYQKRHFNIMKIDNQYYFVKLKRG